MSMKAILTTVVLGLGTSTVALARPARGLEVRDHRFERAPQQRAFAREGFRRDSGFRAGYARERVERPIFRERVERPIVRERVERPIVRERWDNHERWERPRAYGYNYGYGYVAPAPVYVAPPVVYSAPATPFVDGAMSISLGNVACNGIELAANGGETYVQQVVITYSDGRTQLVQLGRELDADEAPIEIGSDGSPVAAVTIYGSGSGVSAYAM